MPKFRIEMDGQPGLATIVQDGEARFDIAQFGLILDAPTGQSFVSVSRIVPGGTFNTCQDITKATLLIETKEG